MIDFPKIDKQDYLILSVILVLNALFLNFNAFRGLNEFDISAFTDATWRIMSGQQLYTDFEYISGPVHLYLNALFFSLFGITKLGFLVHLIVVHSLAIVLTFLIAKKYLNSGVTVLVTLLTTTCFYWPISHPWYDQTAHLFGFFALFAITYTIPFENEKTAFRVGLLAGAMAAFAFMSKSNVGGLYGLLFGILFLSGNHKWKSINGLVTGFCLIFVFFILLIREPQLYFEQALQAFSDNPMQSRRRFLPLLRLSNWFQDGYWLAVFSVIFASFPHWQKIKEFLILAIGLAFVSILSALTSSMKVTANIPLLGMFMTFIFITLFRIAPFLRNPLPKKINQISKGICITLTAFMIIFSAKRGLALEAWTYGGLNPYGTYAIKTKALKGWKIEEKTGMAIDGLVEFINREIPKDDSILVLTDLQILYALTGRESYKGVPFIFMVLYEPAMGKPLEKVREHIMNDKPDWIITHRERTYTTLVDDLIAYMGLRDFIINNYIPVAPISNYIVLKKK